MLQILGRANSSNVQKVTWCCDELGLEFERKDIGGPFGGNKEPDYLALNPNGTVPTIIDDGFVLWESNSIIRYLAAKHGADPFYPADLQTRARGERWMDWQLAVAHRAHVPVYVAMARTAPEKRDMAKVSEDRKVWSAALAILDRYLGETDFVSGPHLSVGDLPMGINVHRWFALDIEREDYANLKRWYDRLCDRPGFQKHVVAIRL